jgi:hypothetical protein
MSAESDDNKVGDGDHRVTGMRIFGLALNFFSTVMKCSTVLLALPLSS